MGFLYSVVCFMLWLFGSEAWILAPDQVSLTHTPPALEGSLVLLDHQGSP